MTTLTSENLICHTEAIRAKNPDYWRNDQAQVELAALWGEAINAHGVFVDFSEEVILSRKGCRASITIGGAHGVFAFGCQYQTSVEGFGYAPSIKGELFFSEGKARSAAIEELKKTKPHEISEQVNGVFTQMSLF
jgi:hypothetical protein